MKLIKLVMGATMGLGLLSAQEIPLKISTKTSYLHKANDALSVGLGGIGAATFADDYSLFHNAGKYVFLKEQLAKSHGLINHSNGIAISNSYFFSGQTNYTALSGGGLITNFMACPIN